MAGRPITLDKTGNKVVSGWVERVWLFRERTVKNLTGMVISLPTHNPAEMNHGLASPGYLGCAVRQRAAGVGG